MFRNVVTYVFMERFEDLYQRHVGAVYRFSLRCVGREDLAEEFTADAFLELYRNFETIEAARLPSWLFTVVKNRSIDYWRRQGLERRHSESLPRKVAAPIQPLGILELLGAEVLKPVHRVCMVLRYVHDLSYEEIAAKTGMSPIQVKGHLQYARSLLRKEMTGTA